MSKRDGVDRERIERQLAVCRRLLDAVGAYGAAWRGRGGRPMADLTDVLLHTFLARSTRTFEAIVHLGSRGFGEQAAMLNRSLFEDMVDAHWVSLHRGLAYSACASTTATATSSSSMSRPASRSSSGKSYRRSTRR
jgi:hypothetical protein